ncbi:PilZ domain-containing protein [Cognatiluteimonas telluris]|uniref:PilZ domain-containing protein n=1 Tax=Cognatiluteimonas telluris TaxID=1104775 RepID=UPI00140A70FE|nr:PilZ domain-containing protein [Lysobacter telluris]
METTTEQRRFRRQPISSAVIVTPNGHGHDTRILDISEGGACVALPSDWVPVAGAPLKILFLADSPTPLMLKARVARVGMDHLGVEFDPVQDDSVRALLEGLGRPL